MQPRMLQSLDPPGQLIEEHLRCTCFCSHRLCDARYAFPHHPPPWLLVFWLSVSFLGGMAGPWATTQAPHPLGAAIATPPSKSKAGEERPGGLQTQEHHGVHYGLLPPPLSQRRAARGHWVMTLGIQVLIPDLRSIGSFLVCKMGLIVAHHTCLSDAWRTSQENLSVKARNE